VVYRRVNSRFRRLPSRVARYRKDGQSIEAIKAKDWRGLAYSSSVRRPDKFSERSVQPGTSSCKPEFNISILPSPRPTGTLTNTETSSVILVLREISEDHLLLDDLSIRVDEAGTDGAPSECIGRADGEDGGLGSRFDHYLVVVLSRNMLRSGSGSNYKDSEEEVQDD
jgi:hypothetical protein